MRIVELEDHGQDFTEFLIDRNNCITEARPFQSWVWIGFRIAKATLHKGRYPQLSKPGKQTLTLRYPAIRIKQATTR